MSHPYLTRALLQQRVGGPDRYLQLMDASDVAMIGTSLESLVLSQVDSLVDGYAKRGGYTTPLADSDATSVLLFLLDISNFKLKSRGDREASEDDRLQYENAMKVMELIGKGEWVFPSGSNSDVTSAFGIDSEEQWASRTLLSDF